MMDSIGLDEDTPIENKMLSHAIESAQSKVEEPQLCHPADGVLQYDDVMNQPARNHLRPARQACLDGDSRPRVPSSR